MWCYALSVFVSMYICIYICICICKYNDLCLNSGKEERSTWSLLEPIRVTGPSWPLDCQDYFTLYLYPYLHLYYFTLYLYPDLRLYPKLNLSVSV